MTVVLVTLIVTLVAALGVARSPRAGADAGYDPRGVWTGLVPSVCQGAKCVQGGGGSLTITEWNPSTGAFTGTSDDAVVFTGDISGTSVTFSAEADGVRTDANLTISADGETWSGGIRYNSATENVEVTGAITMTRVGGPPAPLTDPEVVTLLDMLGPAWSAATAVKPQCDCGDPVNPATGTLSMQQTDVAVPGLGLGLEVQRTYNSMGPAAPGRFGAGWTDLYGARITSTGPFVTVWLGSGATVPFKDSATGYTAPAWVTASLAHSAAGGWELTFTDRTTASFDAFGRLIAMADRTGDKTTIGYDTSGALASVTDASGRVMAFTADAAGRVTAVTDPAGRKVSYGYGDAGDLVRVTDVAGAVTTYGYDARHRMTSLTDPAGHTTTTTYDDAGRVVGQVDPAGNHLAFAYAGTFPDLTTTITDGNDNHSVFAYHGGALVSMTDGAGGPGAAATTFTYDAHLAVASMTDPNGQVWTYVADAAGNVTSVTDPLGRTSRATYDALNDQTSMTDAAGVVRTVAYDDHGLALKAVIALGTPAEATVHIERDQTHPGEITAVIDPSGAKTAYRYDAFGNLVGETNAVGGESSAAYDAAGRVTSTVGPLGHVSGGDPAIDTTTYTYDSYGSITEVVDPQGNRATATYDSVGNVATSTDAAGHVTTFTNDANGRLTATTFADGASERITYDGVGNVLTRIDAAGTATTFTYDALGRTITRTDAAGNVWSRSYDRASNLVDSTDPLGRVTHYAYDHAAQLTGITYDDRATAPVTFTYDDVGRRTSMADATGTSRYTYDAQSRLVAATDGAGHTVTHAFDVRGDVTAVTYPSGLKVGHTFDPLGRLTVVADGLGHDNTFTYGADGDLLSAVLGDGTTSTLTHDRNGAPLSITDATASGSQWASFTVSRDPLAQITNATTLLSGAPAAPAAATYDLRQHLLGFGTQRFSVDANGWLTGTGDRTFTRDRLGRLVDTGDTTFTFDADGQRTGSSGPSGPSAYRYDQAGRLTTLSMPDASIAPPATTPTPSPKGKGGGGSTVLLIVLGIVAAALVAAFVIVRRKRRGPSGAAVVALLIAASLPVIARTAATSAAADHPSLNASYTYNGDGLRTGAVNPDATKAGFVWDQVDSWPNLIGDGALQFVVGPGGAPLEQIDSAGTPSWLHADLQRNVRVITDATGKVTATYTYDPFGRIVAHTGQASTPIGWQGQYTDAGTGLHYLLARYYDPATAQFLTLDPAVDSTGQPYDYAANNPLNNSDASGLAPTPWYSRLQDFALPFSALAGHGSLSATTFTVPEGTWLHFHGPPGASITDALGIAIESGHPTKYNEVYGPGDVVNDHLLMPPDGIAVQPTSTTVKQRAKLSALLKPNQGHIHWAACRPVEDQDAVAADALRDLIRSRPYQGRIWHTTGPIDPRRRDYKVPDGRYYQINGPVQ